MPFFPVPEVKEFYDNRLIISCKINQPSHLSELSKIIIQITGNPPLNFEPLQDSKIEIPKLNGNDLIINWVFQKPTMNTEILLEIQNHNFYEKHLLVISPDNDFQPEYHK
jgi:hypothetical protein